MRLPDEDVGVYLDTNVLFDLLKALGGAWRPVEPLNRTDRQNLAAARLLFYGCRERWTRWYLVTSGETRRELTRRNPHDWTVPFIFDVDEAPDAPPSEAVESLSHQCVQVGLREADSGHLARAILRPWISYFVTNDDELRSRSARLDLPPHLQVVSAVEAEALLAIEPGEQPPIAPHSSSPLANIEPWWIPAGTT